MDTNSRNDLVSDTVDFASRRDSLTANYPTRDARERSAQQMWRIGNLSTVVKRNTEKARRYDSCPSILIHGLQHVTHVPSADGVSHVTCMADGSGFMSLHHSGHVRLYHPDGRLRDPSLQPAGAVPYEGLSPTQLPGRVVGWGPGAVLTLLDMQLKPVSQAQEPLDVRVCQSLAGSLQLVTAGAGNVCVWSLRHMVCRVRVVEGLGRRSVFTLLALAPPIPPTGPRALAASRTSVTTVDLAEGRVLEYKRNLHPRDITGLVYCPLQEAVVTASRDMTIRVWGLGWNLLMSFMGHTAAVSSLLQWSDSGLLLSSSLDGTLRCWSLEEWDQVQAVSLPSGCAPPLGLGGPSTASTFCSFSRTGLNFWNFTSLCQLHCNLGGESSGPVHQILAPPFHRPYPARALCVHGDSDVTLVSTETGAVLTAFRANSKVRCVDYCLHKETLLALTEDGTVIRASTLTNPMTQLDEWHGEQQGDWSSRKKQGVVEPACCMALYSSIADPQMALEEWSSLQNQRGCRSSRRNLQDDAKNRFLVMLGHQGGCVSVIQMHSGIVQYRLFAHDGQNISSIQAYPDTSCLLTTGEDNSVLLWRVFPYAQECVSLQASVLCAHSPVCVALLNPVLAICLQQPHSATYCLVQYNLHTNTRMDHPPEHDHSSTILGLCASQMLRVFVSCSQDGTVRIWDEENHLLRILELSVECIQFSGEQAQLLLGIRGALHTLCNSHLLDHQLQLLCNEDPVLDTLTSTKSTHQPDESPFSKIKFPDKQKTNDPDWECMLVRNRDLQGLQCGEIQSTKMRKSTHQTRRKAFTRYIHILYSQPTGIHIPEEDPFDLLTLLCPPKPSEAQPLTPPTLQDGFFPNRSQAKNQDEARSDQAGLSVPGCVPNSVLAGRLWPREILEQAPRIKPWTLRDDLNFGLLQGEADEGQFFEDDEFDLGSPINLLETPPKSPSPSPPPTPAPPPPPATTPREVKYTLKPLKPLPPVKKALPPPPQSPPPSPPSSPPTTATPPPPRPSSPQLPHFLFQFLQEQWFHTVFPERRCIPETLSASEFCDQLLDFLKCCDVGERLGVVRGVVTLHAQGLLHHIQHITHSLLTVLQTILHSNMTDEEQRLAAEMLNFLVCVNPHNHDITVELLLLLADKELRFQGVATSMLQALGVDDVQQWLLPQAELWQSAAQRQENPLQALRDAALHWLHGWAEQYRVQKRPVLVQDAGGTSVVAPAEVLRYFCWVQREAQGQPLPPLEGRKDTVLLHTQSHRSEVVQRLGETYTMFRVRETHGRWLPPLASRPALLRFPHLLSLRVSHVTLSSVPLSLDPHGLREPPVQRYFIPERSYVHYYK